MIPSKVSSVLTSGVELPRLAQIFQPSYGWTDSAGLRPDGFLLRRRP
jgi:hypothetical protein